MSTPAASSLRLAPAQALELEALLEALVSQHEKLLELAGAHLEAVRRADHNALRLRLEEQQDTLQRIADLEQRRAVLVNTLTQNLPARAGRGPVTLSELAGAAPEPQRSTLLARARTLRELIHKVKQEQGTLRWASRSLAAHMEGVMRQVAKRLSHAGTYGRHGAVDADAVVLSALDLRS